MNKKNEFKGTRKKNSKSDYKSKYSKSTSQNKSRQSPPNKAGPKKEKRPYHHTSGSRGKISYKEKNRIKHIKANETVDDIVDDIKRIEKEIQLEIKEIKSMKLGM